MDKQKQISGGDNYYKSVCMYVCTPYVHLLYIYSSIPYDTIIFSNNLVLFVCLPYHEQPANKQTKPQNSNTQPQCYVN